MGISPVAAVPKVLEQTGLSKDDIDVFEVISFALHDGAFANQHYVIRSMKRLHRNSPTVWRSYKSPWTRSIPSKHL